MNTEHSYTELYNFLVVRIRFSQKAGLGYYSRLVAHGNQNLLWTTKKWWIGCPLDKFMQEVNRLLLGLGLLHISIWTTKFLGGQPKKADRLSNG